MAVAHFPHLATLNEPSLPRAGTDVPRSTRAISRLHRSGGALPLPRRGEAGRSNSHSHATDGAAPFNRPYPQGCESRPCDLQAPLPRALRIEPYALNPMR